MPGWWRLHGAPQHLKAIRLAVLGIWLWILFNTPFEAYGMLPKEAIRGVGIGRGLLAVNQVRDFFFSSLTLSALRWGTAAAVVLALLAPRKGLLLLISLNVLLLDQFTKAISAYPNHAQFAPLATLVVVAVMGNRDMELPDAVGATSPKREALIWLIAVLLLTPYTFIGVNRVLEGGAVLFVGDALPRYMAYTRELYSAYPFGLPESIATLPVVVMAIKCGFFVTTIFEISSPAVLLSPIWRCIWLVYMCGFHLATLFLMNIFFWEQLILIAIVFGWSLPQDLRHSWREISKCRRASMGRGSRLQAS